MQFVHPCRQIEAAASSLSVLPAGEDLYRNGLWIAVVIS